MTTTILCSLLAAVLYGIGAAFELHQAAGAPDSSAGRPRLLGPSRARDLLLTGATFTPAEAHDWGLVARLFDPEDADDLVRAYAVALAHGPALAIAAIKRCVHEGGEKSLDDGLALEAELMEMLFRTKDADEGLHAFAEKRKAEFVGA